MIFVNGNTWEIIDLTPSITGTLIFTIYARDSLGNWNSNSYIIMVNTQGGNGNTGLTAEEFDLIAIFSTIGIIGILTLVIVIILRPKRFMK
jgi:hypothetical protein